MKKTIIMMDVCHTQLSKLIESTILRVNPRELLWTLRVIIMCQYMFILSNNCIILVNDADYRETFTCVQAQFCCEPNSALKKAILKKASERNAIITVTKQVG